MSNHLFAGPAGTRDGGTGSGIQATKVKSPYVGTFRGQPRLQCCENKEAIPVSDVLSFGGTAARIEAQKTLEVMRERLGLNYAMFR